MAYYVYIVTNKYRTVLYTGVTNSLERRFTQHKEGLKSGFTAKYKCQHLLFYETYKYVNQAIAREKQIKNWKREWKIELIKTQNPEMEDLSKYW
jgi:putative endonuclease